MTLTRIIEVPSREALEAFILQNLQAAMPQAGPQAFSDGPLLKGEINRVLKSLMAMLVEPAWDIRNLGRQLTPTDAQEDYVDAVMGSKGLPPRNGGETPDEYVQRVLQKLLVDGVTMPKIKANLEFLGYEAELYPFGENLLVPSKQGRVPSTRRGVLPNGIVGGVTDGTKVRPFPKAGTYVVHLWGQTNANQGVATLIDGLTSAGYAFMLHHHVHWNQADDLLAGGQLYAVQKRRRKQLFGRRNRNILAASTYHGVPSLKSYPLGGTKLSYYTKHRKITLFAPEADIISYLPTPTTETNRFVVLDYNTASSASLSYTVDSEVLTNTSSRSCLQAGPSVTKRS